MNSRLRFAVSPESSAARLDTTDAGSSGGVDCAQLVPAASIKAIAGADEIREKTLRTSGAAVNTCAFDDIPRRFGDVQIARFRRTGDTSSHEPRGADPTKRGEVAVIRCGRFRTKCASLACAGNPR